MSLIARTSLLLLGTAAFLLNPLACAPDGETDADDYTFGDTELRGAVEGLWRVTTTPASGSPTTYTFRLAQASGPRTTSQLGSKGLVRAAMACGSRTLVRSAAACVDVTTMPLTGMIVDGPASFRILDVKGEMMVSGLNFTQGQLTVVFGSRKLFGQIAKDGTVTNLSGDLIEGGPATMVRLPQDTASSVSPQPLR